MLTTRSAVRSTSLILSATLLAIAAEPLPTATSLPGVSGQGSGYPASVSYGDLDGDGFVDMAIGDTIYWGSATGWNGTDKIQTTISHGYTLSLWIVPNVSGAGTDGKIRADLVSLDSYQNGAGTGALWQVLADTTHGAVSLSASPVLDMPSMRGRPAVGDFTGDSLNDVAWIDGAGYGYSGNARLRIAANSGTLLSATSYEDLAETASGVYSGVAAVDWMGVNNTGTGPVDLFVVTTDSFSSPEALVYAHGSLGSPAVTVSLNGGAIYSPEITVGNIDGDNFSDIAISQSGGGFSQSNVVHSTGQLTTSPAPEVTGISDPGIVWILPDVTGDTIDDLAFIGSHNEGATYGGLIHGGSDIAAVLVPESGNSIAIDRPIPVDGNNSLLYQFGFSSYPTIPFVRPIAVAYTVNATQWERHLVLADYSGNGSTTTSSVLPILAPTIVASQQTVTASGAQPIVDSAAIIQFPTTNGQIIGMSVIVNDALVTDSFADTTALPAGVIAHDGAYDQGSFTRSYAGIMTVAEATAVLTGIRFTPAPGGAQRSIAIVLVGKADSTDATPAYASARFQSATVDAAAPALAFTTITGANVGGTVIAQVSGGTAPYTIIVDGGTGLVGGTSSSQARGTTALPTNLFITPNKPGTVTVTVTDSTSLRGSFTFVATDLPKATEPAPVVAASVGAQTVFGAICPGTVGGVESLRTAFGSADNRTARGFTWDSASQTYRELPSEPTGGLLPTDGVFLATRVNLGLDFSGPAMPPGSAIVLRAGWNFVGLGPVQLTGGTVVRTHSLADDFNLTDLSSTTVATTNISSAYLWDGATYSSTAVLQSGIGYWIKNVASPAGTLLLTRKDSDFDGRALHTTEFARNVDTPPAPPTAQTSAADSADGGGCGAGSGIAIALGGLLAFLRLGFRRSSK